MAFLAYANSLHSYVPVVQPASLPISSVGEGCLVLFFLLLLLSVHRSSSVAPPLPLLSLHVCPIFLVSIPPHAFLLSSPLLSLPGKPLSCLTTPPPPPSSSTAVPWAPCCLRACCTCWRGGAQRRSQQPSWRTPTRRSSCGRETCVAACSFRRSVRYDRSIRGSCTSHTTCIEGSGG